MEQHVLVILKKLDYLGIYRPPRSISFQELVMGINCPPLNSIEFEECITYLFNEGLITFSNMSSTYGVSLNPDKWDEIKRIIQEEK